MAMPQISVIVPVYKVEDYLDRCLQSITSQTYQNLEILLVDDGSPDKSGAICDAWAEKDSRIHVIHQENSGAGAARNAALEAAGGELIGFVDSDDYIAPDFYTHLYSMVKAGADIAECSYLETQADNAIFDTEFREITQYTPEEAMRGHIRDTVFRQLIWNKLYRREVLQGVRFPQEKTAIDDEYFTYQALGKARRLMRSETVLYAYRQQPGSIMHSPYSLKKLNGIRAKECRLAYLKEKMPALVLEARQELLYSCIYGMQGALWGLSGRELEEARAYLNGVVVSQKPAEKKGLSGKQKLLLSLAEWNLEKTANVLNFLIRIHVLT